MGKSDEFVFAEYRKLLTGSFTSPVTSAAFLGFSQENNFTRLINVATKDFYDLSLENWDINDQWVLKQKYDFIVCTRCPYFSKNPKDFIQRCKDSLTDKGLALIDWGLGDHWRFQNYKVGWVRHGEHEFAYKESNLLYSCFWNDEIAKYDEVQKFWSTVKNDPRFGYQATDSLDEVVRREVPQLIDYRCKKVSAKFLWPESPQLYIMTLIEK